MIDPEPQPVQAQGVRGVSRRAVLIRAASAAGAGGAVAAVLAACGASSASKGAAKIAPTLPAPASTPPLPSVLPESARRAKYVGYPAQVLYRPDGKSVAVARQTWNGVGEQNTADTVDLLDAATGRVIRSFSAPDCASTRFAFSADGRSLVTGGYTAILWDVDSGRRIRGFGDTRDGEASAVALTPDGRTLIVGGTHPSGYGFLVFYDVESGERTGEPASLDETQVAMVSVSPDGKTVAVSGGSSARLVSVPNGHVVAQLDGGTGFALFSPDGKSLYCNGTASQTTHEVPLLQRDAAGGSASRIPLSPVPDEFQGFALSPDGRTLAFGGNVAGKHEGAVWLVNTASKRTTRLISLGSSPDGAGPAGVYVGGAGLAFSPDGRTLAITTTTPVGIGKPIYELQLWQVG